MRCYLTFAAILFLAATASAQTFQPIRVQVIYDATDASSSAVAPLLIKKIVAQPKFFAVVKGDKKDMSVVADCYRDTANDPYSCFYAASVLHGITESFLGGAVVVKKSAEDAATALFASLLLDVVQRWNGTNRRMTIGELETCLALTESSCAVPKALLPELKVKSINLSEYLRRGGLKP
ncbi:MAG: hypothetical protein ACYDD2_13060 [Candidatus Acidiferrales bacterium]